MELEFNISHQKLTRLDHNEIVNKTRNYITLLFTFTTEDWDDLDTFLILKDEAGQNYLFDLDEETPSVTVPEIVLRGGFFKLSVFGFNDDVRLTTNSRTIHLRPSGYTTSHIRPLEPGDYSKDIFENFIGKIDGKVDEDLDFFVNKLIEGIQGA